MANNMLIDSILKRQQRDYFMRHPSQYDEFRAIILNKKRESDGTPKRQPETKPTNILPSLRSLEFVTTYLARHDDSIGFYQENADESIRYIDIHDAYKNTLGTYGKRRFDSFRRTPLFEFSIPSREGKPITTTVGQLQWYRWICEMRIIDWVKKNWQTGVNVRKEMAANLKTQRTNKRSRAEKRKKMIFQQRVRSGKIIIKW